MKVLNGIATACAVRLRQTPVAIAAIALLLTFPGAKSAFATTWYVDPQGVNQASGGTTGAPWKTLAYACSQTAKIVSGDVIHLNAGTFTETAQSSVPLGVSIEGAGQSSTTITTAATGLPGGGYLIHFVSPGSSAASNGNQSIHDLSLTGQNRTARGGVYVQSRNNVSLYNLSFNGFTDGGAWIDSVGYHDRTTAPLFYITGIQVYNCTFTSCGIDYSAYNSGALNIGGLSGAQIHNLVIDNTASEGEGIKFSNGGWYKGLKIFGCDIRTSFVPQRTGYTYYGREPSIELWHLYQDSEIYNNYLRAWISIAFGDKGTGTYSVRVHDNILDLPTNAAIGAPAGAIYGAFEFVMNDARADHNFFIDCGPYCLSLWDGGGNEAMSNTTIDHNLVYGKTPNNQNRFIHASRGKITGTYIFNNTVYGCEMPILIQTQDAGHPTTWYMRDTQIKNNVFQKVSAGYSVIQFSPNTAADGGITNTVLQNNLYYDLAPGVTFVNNAAYVISSSGNIGPNTDPGLTLSGAQPDPYFAPASAASAVVDAGVDVGLPFVGAKPDIGAFEWGDTGAPDFGLSASPASASMVQGASASGTLTITPSNGFVGTVGLTASGLPTGASASFTPSTVSGSGTSAVTIATSAATPTGTYTITVTGTSGSLTHTATLTLTVTSAASPDFALSASPSALSVGQGSSGTSTVSVQPSGGFSGSVNLSATGLPTGVTAAFGANPATSNSVVTFTVLNTAATGTSTVTISGTSGSLMHTTQIALTVTAASGSGGSLTGSTAANTGVTTNLTTTGTSDWINWGYGGSATAVNRKASGGSKISSFSATGTVGGGTGNSAYYTWTDGPPTASVTKSSGYVKVTGQNNSFTITVPADTTSRTIKVYVSNNGSSGNLTASLSDGSAAAYSATNSSGNQVFTLIYKAASAGQTLTVTWKQTSTTGFITLQSAVLQ